ncbi:hypothetical protein OEZ86_000084 [Tetradesmus obliquus]|nr:hypothetical protein OEZ86_000084 [Tetradesmus obliquus]
MKAAPAGAADGSSSGTAAGPGEGFVLQHQLQPFAAAFAAGDWLLLDELNLAPDDVLQCIEQALDTGVITLHNPSSASQPIIMLQQAPGFRLFATQNPNAGFFKGRREALSAALVNRFAAVMFQQLPAAEWEQVVAAQLAAGGLARQQACEVARVLVAFHGAVQEKISSSSFPELQQPDPAKPFVLTSRILRAWQVAGRALMAAEPLLVVGRDGSGKSECLRALSWLLGEQLQQFNLTPETEPSALVGQFVPHDSAAPTSTSSSSSPQDPIVWVDGAVTAAFRAGGWLCLDGLGEAEASVLERLNPLLESPPIWTVTEQGCTDQLPRLPSFRFLATMTPPSKQGRADIGVLSAELSPALYNRLSIVVLDDPLEGSDEEFAQELQQLAQAMCVDAATDAAGTAVAVAAACRHVRCWVQQRSSSGNVPALTLRAYVRLLDSCYAMQMRYQLPMPEALLAAFDLCLAGQLVGAGQAAVAGLRAELQKVLQVPGPALSGPDHLQGLAEAMSCEHVLTGSRCATAQAVAAAIACNMPVLLEGPAAVGKTSLVSAIARFMPQQQVLERVNNTESTDLQDYIGSYLPAGDGTFTFNEGPLLRCARLGHWLLLDELNLADPAVLSALCPLLEGASMLAVPGTSLVVPVHPGLRIFATQNSAAYANRHALPLSIRSRFLEVQVKDFTEPELCEVISKRQLPAKISSILPAATSASSATGGQYTKQQGAAAKPLAQLAAALGSISSSQLGITLREVMKILRRHVVLGLPLPDAAVSLLAPRVAHGSAAAQQLQQQLQALGGDFASAVLPQLSDYRLTSLGAGRGVRLAAGPTCYIDVLGADLARIKQHGPLPAALTAGLVQVAFAVAAAEPVMLLGPTCFKSKLVALWAELMGLTEDVVRVHLSPETEGCALIGQITPYTFAEALQLLDAFMSDADLAEAEDAAAQFAPSLGVRQQQQQQQVEPDDAADTFATLWDSEADAAGGGWQVPAAAGSSALWGSAAGDDSGSLEDEPWEQLSQGSKDGMSDGADAFELLFGQSGNDGSDRDAASAGGMDSMADTAGAVLLPASDASADWASSSSADDTRHSAAAAALADTAETLLLDPPPAAAAEAEAEAAPAAAGSDAAPAVAAAYPDSTTASTDPVSAALPGSGVEQQAASDSFDEFLASLSLQQQSGLRNAQSSRRQQLAAAAAMPDGLKHTMQQIVHLLAVIVAAHDSRASGSLSSGSAAAKADTAAHQMLHKIKSLWQRLSSPALRTADPLFIFRDGPVTRAAKAGSLLLLEDFDGPSQAVTERLNSLLEPEPSFAASEDITLGPGGADVVLPPSFQVFATVHQASGTQRINISPATRSRFTTITLTPYTQDDIQALLQQQLTAQLCVPGGGGLERGASSREVQGLLDLLLTLVDVTEQQLRATPNARQLLRCVQYIAAATAEPSLAMRLLVGFRWLVLDSLQPDPAQQQELAARVLEHFSSNSSSGKGSLDELQQLLDAAFQPPDDALLQQPGALLRALPSGHVQLAFTGVAALAAPAAADEAAAAQPQLLAHRLQLSPTPSLVSNMARILAASTVQGPLLLEGPPGIGKTAVVQQVACLLGFACERINFSANTTQEQLLGSFIPKVVGGQRVFAWQDGVVVRAVRQGKWLLLDEINLAPPEVLATVAPLFDRDTKHFILPNSDSPPLDISSTRIFATMNPASVGGGRSRLPRSVRNLFTAVQLQKPSAEEIKSITLDLFAECLNSGLLDQQHAACLLNFHTAAVTAAERRDLGRAGAAAEFNLRDLIKVRDIIWANMKDELHHIQLEAAAAAAAAASAGGSATGSSSGGDNSGLGWVKPAVGGALGFGNSAPAAGRRTASSTDLRLQVLCKVLFSVYGSRFPASDDQEQVQQLIAEHMEVQERELVQSWDTSIECSVPATLRVGAVFLSKGNCLPLDQQQPMAHTPGMLRMLERVAAASQSGRVVLLEGQTCSGKTQLVVELARLAQRQLVVINLTAETETSQLIGQWLPASQVSPSATLQPSAALLLQRLIKLATCQCLQSPSAQSALRHLETQLMQLQEQLSNKQSSHGISFVWVESLLVTAMREGHWVLLDNFNTAPPEVMERLNSLFEDSPSLHLYEHSDGEVLSRAAETIHPNFRLFGTCNPGRISAHKVSSALLNRVIRICLLPLDAGLTLDNADEHDLMHILAHRFSGVHGGLELASLCVRFHARVAAAVAAGQVKLLGGYPLTARSMLFAAQGALQYMQASGCSPVAAAVKALLTTYLPGIAIRDQQLLLLRAAADTLTSPDLGSKLSYEQPAAGAAGTDTWQQQAAGLSSKLAQLEEMVAAACWALVPTVPGVAIAAEYAKQGPGITAALVDRLAALSCQATLANGLAAALEGADKALSQAAQGASCGGSSADASHRQRTGSRIKKKQKAQRKQQKRQQKQELKALHSNAAIASLQQAAEAVDVLADGEDACQLLRWLSHTQCTAHSSLAEALLADCKAAGAASAAGGSQPLPLHVAQSGHFGRCLQGAGAASLSPALASCWADLLLGLPVAAAASITAVQAQELEQHVRQLHDRHLRVTSLAAGQRMLAQLQQLSKQAPHALELRRLTKAIKDQMGCADTYLQYTQLQKQEMLSSLEQQLARLLAEARGVKPSPGALVSAICQVLAEVRHMSGSQQLAIISLHTISQLEMQLNGLRSKLRSHIVELQASNPLYRQIPDIDKLEERLEELQQQRQRAEAELSHQFKPSRAQEQQAAEMQLHATGRAFLPASYLGLRFVDVLLAMKQSLFVSMPAAATTSTGTAAAAAESAQQEPGSPLQLLEQSVAAQCLNGADAAAVQGLLRAFTALMQLDVSASPETGLVASSGASELLDGFKLALSSCTEQMEQGRPKLQPCCRMLCGRGELLQKEVLKAEVTLVDQAFAYQVQAGQEEHLQHMQTSSSSLWRALPDTCSSSNDIAGFVPDWQLIQLGCVAPSQLPAVLKLLEARGPAEAAGQLEPGSTAVLAWIAEHQHQEDWAYSQVSAVVCGELQQVLSGIKPEGFLQREAEVAAVLKKWVQSCDELVEARRLDRRGLMEKLLHQKAGELEAWRRMHEQGLLAKEEFDTQLRATESQLESCFELCCHLATAQQAAGKSTWSRGLTELFVVTGGATPASPLHGNPVLQRIRQQCEGGPRQVRLSSNFVWHDLSSADKEQFKGFSYARLELPPAAGSFMVQGSAQQAVNLTGGRFDYTIQIADPDNCQMTAWFFGEPKDSTQNSSFWRRAVGAVVDAAGAVVDAMLQRPADFSKCVPMGKPITFDVAAVPYRSSITFGSGSRLQHRALYPLHPLLTMDLGCDSKQPITGVAGPGMHEALQQDAPRQLQQLAAQLDAVLVASYKALGLALCILAATAGSLSELQAAEKRFNQGSKALHKLASAEVRQPVWSLRLPGGQQVAQRSEVPVVPLQPGQSEQLDFQLHNEGDTVLHYELSAGRFGSHQGSVAVGTTASIPVICAADQCPPGSYTEPCVMVVQGTPQPLHFALGITCGKPELKVHQVPVVFTINAPDDALPQSIKKFQQRYCGPDGSFRGANREFIISNAGSLPLEVDFCPQLQQQEL